MYLHLWQWDYVTNASYLVKKLQGEFGIRANRVSGKTLVSTII